MTNLAAEENAFALERDCEMIKKKVDEKLSDDENSRRLTPPADIPIQINFSSGK
jgi:hypothetical protein